MTTAVTASTAAATQASGSRTTSSLGTNFNTFLTLLTTELKNQDPTKAMDTDAMTQQLATFASVEQQTNTNTNLQTLIGLQQSAGLAAAAPIIGKTVEVESDKLSLQTGVATLRLPAAGAATAAHVTITDSQGQVLREVQVPLGTRTTDWQWDGRNTAGKLQPDGAYGFTVAGLDSAGGAQRITATVLARATAADRLPAANGGTLQLVLGGLTVGFDAVRSLGGS